MIRVVSRIHHRFSNDETSITTLTVAQTHVVTAFEQAWQARLPIDVETVERRQWRQLRAKTPQKAFQLCLGASEFDGDAFAVIPYPPGQFQFGRQLMHIGPESDTLHPPSGNQAPAGSAVVATCCGSVHQAFGSRP